MKEVIFNKIDDLAENNNGALIEGYSAMARDAARKHEAEEWSVELIGDASTVEPCAPSPARSRATYFETARSRENAPAPRNNSAAAMASTSR